MSKTRKDDLNVSAFDIVQQATGQAKPGRKGVRNLFRPLLDHRRFGFTVFPYLLALRGGPEKVPDPFSSDPFSSLFVFSFPNDGNNIERRAQS
jgi:hypothetical protein